MAKTKKTRKTDEGGIAAVKLPKSRRTGNKRPARPPAQLPEPVATFEL